MCTHDQKVSNVCIVPWFSMGCHDTDIGDFFMDTEDRIINKAAEHYGIVPDVLDEGLGPTTFAVYAALCIYANKDGWAFPAIKTLSEKLKISKDTVVRAIKVLESKNLLEVSRPEMSGRGHFNKYFILDKPINKGGTTKPFIKERVDKGSPGAAERGAPQGQEQYQGTLEQKRQKFFDRKCDYHGFLQCRVCV